MKGNQLGFTPLHPQSLSLQADEGGEIRLKYSEKVPFFRMGVTGFTLVEIMLVIAVILVILTIAVPSFLRSRVIANETAALSNCKTINNACQLYHINMERYPNTLSDMVEPTSVPPYIDSGLASGRKQGYDFIYVLVDSDHFTLNANPVSSGLLKGRYFYMDESGVIRANSSVPAGPEDEIVA